MTPFSVKCVAIVSRKMQQGSNRGQRNESHMPFPDIFYYLYMSAVTISSLANECVSLDLIQL